MRELADGAGPDPLAERTSLVGRHNSVTVTADTVTSAAVRLRRGQPADPPILLALPNLETPPSLAATAPGQSPS